MTVVPDASVIVKWVLPLNISPFQEQALLIRDAAVARDIVLVVPALWRFEVGNTLVRLVPEKAVAFLSLCSAVGLNEFVPHGRWLETAVGLVRRHGVTFYDAAYHALAICRSCIFVTADEKYERKARGEGNIQLLEHWR